jgi:hypothetical protein
MEFLPEDIVQIGDLRFRGGEGSKGFFISRDGLVGWDDSPDVRFDAVQRENADGEFDVPVFYGVRTLTVSGFCYASSSQELGVFRNRLMGLSPNRLLTAVTLHGTKTTAYGAMSAASKFQVDMPGRRAAYQLTRRFVDPRQYGATNTAAGGTGVAVKTFHYGNAPAASVLVVSGSDPGGYTITGPGGRTIVVSRSLDAGQPHTIDMATGLLFIGGVVQYGAMDSADMWVVPPGKTVSQQTNVSSVDGRSHILTITTRDTYI